MRVRDRVVAETLLAILLVGPSTRLAANPGKIGADATSMAASAQPPSPAGDCRVSDLMPDFWAFWAAARDASSDEQVRLFEQMLRRPHAEVYDGVLRSLPMGPAELVPRAIAGMRPVEATVRSLAGQLAAELPRQLALFRQSFPDFRCAMPVYFLFAAGAFDGATRRVGSQTALLFGLDVIAQIHGEQLSPLVVHELFHVHHDTVVPAAPEKLYWAVWKEGLATYVSRKLNPGLAEEKICCLPDIPAVNAMLPSLVADLLSRLDSERPEDYARYLLGGTADIPARSGYALGYRIAQQLGRDRSLAELARLPPEVVRPLLETTLREMREPGHGIGSPAWNGSPTR